LTIDDSLDVFSIHGIGGIVGSILTAPLSSEALGGIGTFSGNGIWGQLCIQILAVSSILLWSGILSWILLKIIDSVVGIRVSVQDETEGLDISQHNEQGYNL
jgi:Amt family ammonium transporter